MKIKSSHHQSWVDSWHVNPSANKDYDLIDGLRGIAILLVLVGHQFYLNPNAGPWEQFFMVLIDPGLGVTIFFALSGFLISLPFWKIKNKAVKDAAVPAGYGWRRFWKIYPPLALSIILLTPVYTLFPHEISFGSTAIKWLAGWPLILPVSGELNPVMWSLAVEVQFYLTLPLAFWCLKKVPASRCLWLLPALFLLLPNLSRWMFWHGVGFTIHPQVNVHYPACLDAFALGILVAGLESQRRLKKNWVWLGDLGFVLLALILILTAWVKLHPADLITWEIIGYMRLGMAALLLLYIANPQAPRSRLLCHPLLRWFGLISYELYLFHQPFLVWYHNLIGFAHGSILKFVTSAAIPSALGLLIAVLVYRYFSLPILKSGRKRVAASLATRKNLPA